MSDDIILAGLNDPQKQAVTTTGGPALILAGAGSGKTRALTHRIAYLMGHGVPPWQILAVTFTNRAATEMKERIGKILQITEGTSLSGEIGQGRMPVMGTFHSVCVRILRRDIMNLGRDRSFVIYDSDDQERMMKMVLRELKIDESELKAKAALGYVSRFKSEAVSPKEALRDATTERMAHVIRAYERYDAELRKANALDFDDLLLETVRLFREHPDVLDRYQETWRYLHVDEYQDTNHVQYLLISLLAKKYRNLCVIGDPDQSIYAFRGADIRNILEFEHEYPDAMRIKLEQNYRSTQLILTASNAVISANPNRPEKLMWSERKEGPKILVQEWRDERTEAQEAVKAAIDMRTKGTNLNDQVVLYRTNAQSRLFEESCMRQGIPYRIIGGVKFYARREVKDVLAYLQAIVNPADTLSLLRVLNIPARKIGDTTLGHLQAFSSTQNLSLWSTLTQVEQVEALNEGVKTRILGFAQIIGRFRELAKEQVVSQLTTNLLAAIGMEKWLRDDTDEGEERWQNVQELLTVTHKYDHLEPMVSLTSFLEEVALVSEVDKLSTAKDDALTLMTLHLCKGLEFEHVMIGGCEEGIFPHSSSMFDREQLEEERRLMYVGMTRAKTTLRMFFARSRVLWGETQSNAPSRFLDDLPSAVIERRSDEVLSAFAWASERGMQQALRPHRGGSGKLEPFRQQTSSDFNQDTTSDDANQDGDQIEIESGTRVRHPSFGDGTVTARRGDVVTIEFDNGTMKSFALSIAPLRVL